MSDDPERRAERMHRRVEPERPGVEAEGRHRREADGALSLLGERAAAEAAAVVCRAHLGDQRHEHLLEAVEDGRTSARRRPRLEVVEEVVVRVGRRLEAGDVLLLELELPIEPGAERGVVVGGPCGDPGFHRLRRGLRQPRREIGGNPACLLPVSPRDADQACVVGVVRQRRLELGELARRARRCDRR